MKALKTVENTFVMLNLNFYLSDLFSKNYCFWSRRRVFIKNINNFCLLFVDECRILSIACRSNCKIIDRYCLTFQSSDLGWLRCPNTIREAQYSKSNIGFRSACIAPSTSHHAILKFKTVRPVKSIGPSSPIKHRQKPDNTSQKGTNQRLEAFDN